MNNEGLMDHLKTHMSFKGLIDHLTTQTCEKWDKFKIVRESAMDQSWVNVAAITEYNKTKSWQNYPRKRVLRKL